MPTMLVMEENVGEDKRQPQEGPFWQTQDKLWRFSEAMIQRVITSACRTNLGIIQNN